MPSPIDSLKFRLKSIDMIIELYLTAKRVFNLIIELKIRFQFQLKTNTKKRHDYIVSLTTYPPRMRNLWLTLESIRRQTYPPKKIVLCLYEGEFEARDLQDDVSTRVDEIIWIKENTKSYKKLQPAMEKYPNDIIITIDDDVIYKKNIMELLLKEHKRNNKCIIGTRGRRMTFVNGKMGKYNSFKITKTEQEGNNLILTGIGAVLYPCADIKDKSIYLNYELASELAPNADDLWFWYSSIKTEMGIYSLGILSYTPIQIFNSMSGLADNNVLRNGNDIQIEKIIQYDKSLLKSLNS
jgi:hypothetical protein